MFSSFPLPMEKTRGKEGRISGTTGRVEGRKKKGWKRAERKIQEREGEAEGQVQWRKES